MWYIESKERNSDECTLSDIYTNKRGIVGGTWMSPQLFSEFLNNNNPI
jgi:hypothetical protein